MTSTGTVAGSERLRLFLALRLPGDALDDIETWQAAELQGELRVVPREQLHITLAFLGHRPAGELPGVAHALRAAAGLGGDYRLRPARYRETRSVGMVVLDDVGGAATALADDLQARLEELGVYRRENRPWLPHVTVARFRARPRLRLEPPTLRTDVLIPSDAAAYLSRPSPAGARYEVLTTAALGG
jgi:RNA 2',3'-cyclic 3'-phosphodiesterase